MRITLSIVVGALVIADVVSGFSRTAGAAAQGPSPVLLVTLRYPRTLAIVDPIAKKEVGRVPIGTGPHGVAASPDGKLGFVASQSGDRILVIDIPARKEIRRLEIPGGRPYDMRFAGGRLYFSAEGYKAVGRYDPATERLEYFGIGQESPHMIAVSRDLTRLFSANRFSKSVSIIELLKGPPDWKMTVVPIGHEGEGIDVTPDGREVWTGNRDGTGVTIVDVATQKVTELDTGTADASRLKISPDGRFALVADNERDVTVVVDIATRKVAKRINVTSGGLVVTPDSTRAYMAGGGNFVTVLDLKGLTIADRIVVGPDVHSLAWAEGR